MGDKPAETSSPLLKADGGTLAFSANAGLLRVRYGGWDEAKVLAPGESLELVARNGQVWAFRRGEPLKGPAPDPYKDWDGTAAAEPVLETLRPAIMRDVPRDRVPVAGGQNDRGAKGE